MELALNLIWAVAALGLIGIVYLGVRRRTVRMSLASSMTIAVLICFILLPAISLSDDLLNASQAQLPLSGQMWRVASEGNDNGLDNLLVAGLKLMLLMCFLIAAHATFNDQWLVRPLAARLARSQRLRPPPFAV